VADRAQLAQDMYRAFAAGDRDTVESLLAPDFSFSSPVDPQLDRDGYFERCWPGAGQGQSFDFVRVVESGDEVTVTYEATRANGTRFRNTEVLTFDGDRIGRAEVYFGWNLE
jgi:ketosteroid isomerase-like protein